MQTNKVLFTQTFCVITTLLFARLIFHARSVSCIHEARWEIFQTVAVFTLYCCFFSKYYNAAPTLQLKAANVLFIASLTIGMSQHFIDSYRFYDAVLQQSIPAGAFLCLFILVSLYAVSCGISALERFSVFLFVLIMLSTIILLVSLVPQMHLPNLQHGSFLLSDFIPKETMPRFPIELALYPIVSNSRKTSNFYFRAFAFSAILDTVIFILCEAILGSMFQKTLYPLQSASRLGELSVFCRLDALYTITWMLISFYVFGFYAVLIYTLLQHLSFKYAENEAYCYLLFIVPTAVFITWKLPFFTQVLASASAVAAMLCSLCSRHSKRSK